MEWCHRAAMSLILAAWKELTDVYGPFVESVSTPACPNYDLAVKRIIFSREVSKQTSTATTAPKVPRKKRKKNRHQQKRI
eukprot:3979475-Amphidinium_carterae.1